MDNNMNNSRALPRNNALLMILGWICAILSLFIYPFAFGLAGVIFGIVSAKNGSRSGLALIVSSIIFMGIGLIMSEVFLNYITHYGSQIFGR
ncbi:MAG: hypothetical protein N2489_00530 [Clostridia bacterium]|nr:hypothetical protein [Clostridia bacterium]